MTIPQAFQTALQHHQSRRLAEAEVLCRQILSVQPNHADTLHLLGVIAHEVGRNDVAVDLIRRAIAVTPNASEAHCSLAEAYRQLGSLNEAIAAYRRVLQLKPGYAEVHNNLGASLRAQGHSVEAIAEYRKAIQFKPGYAQAHLNLGNALRDEGRLEEAIAAYRQTLQLQPDSAEAHINLGAVLTDQGRFEEAVAAFRWAIQLQPGHAEAHNNLALLLLLHGDFEHGWPMYEARWEADDFKPSKRDFPQPMWKGEALDGRRVLLHAEQGLGDTLQFVRYAPLVAERGGQVMVECQPGLKALLMSVDGIAQIVECGEPLPTFDLHCPMMSLPLAFGTRVETIPAKIPYLRTDPQKVTRWRQRLEQETHPASAADLSVPLVPSVLWPGRPLRVGLVWAGGDRPHQPKLRPLNQRRSMRLSQFAPLATIPGVVFVSLQKGGPSAEAKTPPAGMRLVDWTDELEDFADTAALVECLDLVISVDTAVAHLAGALGKPVWLLNRFDTCWRWLMEREDSPWYPTMRLFRQPRFLDWEPVLVGVREQLALLAATLARK